MTESSTDSGVGTVLKVGGANPWRAVASVKNFLGLQMLVGEF
jgi:hypothetical protein